MYVGQTILQCIHEMEGNEVHKLHAEYICKFAHHDILPQLEN